MALDRIEPVWEIDRDTYEKERETKEGNKGGGSLFSKTQRQLRLPPPFLIAESDNP